jgi:anti-sigma B factor antagonist
VDDRVSIDLEKQGDGVCIVRLAGRLDLGNAAEVQRVITDVIAEGNHRLVIDLGGVRFMDTSGLSVLVASLRAAKRAGGLLALASVSEQPRTLFTLTSLDSVFQLCPTVDDALKLVSRRR